jgi:Kef-type K+ transport system membrane component KefB
MPHGPETPHAITQLLLHLFILFLSAKIGAEVFERLRQPEVVGQILGGVLVGPQVLGWVTPNEATRVLAELGVLFLLFGVGLETNPSELKKVGATATAVAIGGVVAPFVLGYLAMVLLGYALLPGLLVATALVATSVGITARVLGRLGRLQDEAARIILAAAVLDDILGLLVLAGVSSFARGSVNYLQIAATAAAAIAFTLFMLTVGTRAVHRTLPAVERFTIGENYYAASLALCLGLAVLAGYLGVAAIIGAFLAGVALSEPCEGVGVRERVAGLNDFLVPFFLAGIGMQLDVGSLGKPAVLGLCLLITLLAVAGKLIGCGAPLLRRDRGLALRVGMGMVPRGEVGVVVAQLGLGMGVLSADLFAVVLSMAVATTMLAPPVLVRLFATGDASAPAAAPDEPRRAQPPPATPDEGEVGPPVQPADPPESMAEAPKAP